MPSIGLPRSFEKPRFPCSTKGSSAAVLSTFSSPGIQIAPVRPAIRSIGDMAEQMPTSLENRAAPCGSRTWQGSRPGAAPWAAPRPFPPSPGSQLRNRQYPPENTKKPTLTISPRANVSIRYQPGDQMRRYNRALRMSRDQYDIRPTQRQQTAHRSDRALPMQVGKPLWVLEQVIIQPR